MCQWPSSMRVEPVYPPRPPQWLLASPADADPTSPAPSTARSMCNQTSGSFTQAGGTPTGLKGKKKAKQEELAPDSAKVIELGLSAFIPKQDAMYNQNKLVLNEAIMAELVLSTVKRLSRDEDTLNSQHKEALNLIADLKASVRTINDSAITDGAFPNLHSRPEFNQLYKFCRVVKGATYLTSSSPRQPTIARTRMLLSRS